MFRGWSARTVMRLLVLLVTACGSTSSTYVVAGVGEDCRAVCVEEVIDADPSPLPAGTTATLLACEIGTRISESASPVDVTLCELETMP